MSGCAICGESFTTRTLEDDDEEADFCPDHYQQYKDKVGITHKIVKDRCDSCNHETVQVRKYTHKDRKAFLCQCCGDYCHKEVRVIVRGKSYCLECQKNPHGKGVPDPDPFGQIARNPERALKAALQESARKLLIDDRDGAISCSCGAPLRHHPVQRFPSGRNVLAFYCDCGFEYTVEVKGESARHDKVRPMTAFGASV